MRQPHFYFVRMMRMRTHLPRLSKAQNLLSAAAEEETLPFRLRMPLSLLSGKVNFMRSPLSLLCERRSTSRHPHQWSCLIKNSVKSKQKRRKYSEDCIIGEFLMRTEPGANGFRAEIVVLRPEGVHRYVERKETAIKQKNYN